MENSDVLIEVLDARDPEGCRNKELEMAAAAQGKKILLVLNKIDLVPKFFQIFICARIYYYVLDSKECD